MNCLIMSETAAFPWGMASTTRVRNLARGLANNGINVEYVGLHGADVEYSAYKKKKGDAQGIRYSYPGCFPVRPQDRLLRRVDDFFGKWLSVVKLLSLKLFGKIDAVILDSKNHKTVLFWSRFLHAINVPVILELCEWPLAVSQFKGTGFDVARIFCHDAILSADAVLPVSNFIEEEVQRVALRSKRPIKSLKIPAIIDTDLDDYSQTADQSKPYLVYFGQIDYPKIASLIVDIVVELKKRGKDINIKFTGSGFCEAFNKLKAYAKERGVAKNFEFTGFLPKEKFHKLMRGALMLLSPVFDDLQSKSEFSSEIVYYLTSGLPVVTTAISRGQDYLIDGTNAFVASDCSAHAIVDKIEQAFNGTQLPSTFGLLGNKKFRQLYSSEYSQRLKEFIEDLVHEAK